MKTIIIPDIHNDTDWADRVIASESHDRIIFLGDYFDNYGDSPEIAGRTAKWLRESLHAHNRIHLLGNHDLSYAFPQNRFVQCPGYTREKRAEIERYLSRWDWFKCRLAFEEQGWMCSHAGIHPSFAHPILGWSNLQEVLKSVLDRAEQGYGSHWLAPGRSRGGSAPHGGIVWLHWGEAMNPDFHQIVGHTQHPSPQTLYFPNKNGATAIMKGIDCGQKFYAIVENGIISTSKEKKCALCGGEENLSWHQLLPSSMQRKVHPNVLNAFYKKKIRACKECNTKIHTQTPRTLAAIYLTIDRLKELCAK